MMRKMMLFKLACAACRVRNIRADSNNLPRARVGKGADELDCERQRKECGYLQGVVAAFEGGEYYFAVFDFDRDAELP